MIQGLNSSNTQVGVLTQNFHHQISARLVQTWKELVIEIYLALTILFNHFSDFLALEKRLFE